MSIIKHFRELDVYKTAMDSMMRVFQISKSFPVEERYSLSDAETEAAETQVWAEIAFRSGYLKPEVFATLDDAYDKIIAQVVRMADQPEKWVIGGKRIS